jgi:DhnA family fructose-bisphosphate aldolase class Ia
MSFNSHKVRLNRFLAADGRCLDVAIDHGVFNEYSFLDGLEDMPAVVKSLVAAGPDAIQMNIGQADLLQEIPGPRKPALVLRTDVGNLYNPTTHAVMFNQLVHWDEPIIAALKVDAAAVVCNLLLMPGQPDLHRQTCLNAARLRAACDRYGMPLMIEPLVLRANEQQGGYQVNGDKNLIVPLVRQARELGADVIKADPTDDVSQYHKVIETASGIPVLVRGGGRVSDKEILVRTEGLLKQGASGIVYGRNVIQHPNPRGITQALMAMVHRNASVDEALKLI